MTKQSLFTTCRIRSSGEFVSIVRHEYRETLGEHWYRVRMGSLDGREVWWPESMLERFTI